MTLYIIFVIELLLLTGFLWYIFRNRYFGSLFIAALLFLPGLAAGYVWLVKNQPQVLSDKIFRRLTPYWGQYLPLVVIKILPLVLLACAVLFVLFLLAYRFYYKKIAPMLNKLKLKMHDKKAEDFRFLGVDTAEYLNADEFFIGVTTNKAPVYLTPSDLVTHMQVVGPSGEGKTVSILFPLTAQALTQDIPVIFIDGKGDSKLKDELKKLCISKNKKMMFFDSLQPSTSATYNPLTSTTDADELSNMLAVALNLNALGDAKIYTDLQKRFLTILLHLFIKTNLRFNFTDIIEFINYPISRDTVYSLANDRFYKEEMEVFLSHVSKAEKELIGLTSLIDQWFVSDPGICEIINTYKPDIEVKDILSKGGAVLFSLSAGKKGDTNQALAKMVLADIYNSVGERHTGSNVGQGFVLVILDEFGQYVSEKFDKFISTARSANVGCVLSHQSNAQLKTQSGDDKLGEIVRDNTSAKVIFRQSEEASSWAEMFGTRPTVKRTEQVITTRFLTEKTSEVGSIQEVDEFIVHPNRMRELKVGQAVFKFKSDPPVVISTGLYPFKNIKLENKPVQHIQGEGLNLRQKRLAMYKKPEMKKQEKQEGKPQTTSAVFK
ncbi:MAG TPA: hypothetical protein DCX95_03010 [Elusimicrobia bacterium]|nr:hypothetical protein [Elusimicrobiota bacterium]